MFFRKNDGKPFHRRIYRGKGLCSQLWPLTCQRRAVSSAVVNCMYSKLHVRICAHISEIELFGGLHSERYWAARLRPKRIYWGGNCILPDRISFYCHNDMWWYRIEGAEEHWDMKNGKTEGYWRRSERSKELGGIEKKYNKASHWAKERRGVPQREGLACFTLSDFEASDTEGFVYIERRMHLSDADRMRLISSTGQTKTTAASGLRLWTNHVKSTVFNNWWMQL